MAVLWAGGVFVQNVEERRGFIGVTVGPAFPAGDIESDAAIALGFGTAARWNCSGRISISVDVYYYYIWLRNTNIL